MQPLTYLYNAQVHKSTNTTRFSLVLSLHPPGPTTAFRPGALASNGYVDIDSLRMRLSLQHKIAALQAKSSSQLKRLDAQYKRNYDVKVYVEWEFVINR